MIKIDGSQLEGGGQIIRTALAFSTIMGKSVQIENIRAGRPKPGLKSQHLYCLKALQEICDAQVEGDELGSESLVYKPGKIKFKSLKIDVKTAGSVTLVLQALLLVHIFVNKRVKITILGGTDVSWSPTYDYFKDVILAYYQNLVNVDVRLVRRGFYPKGGGVVELVISPLNDIDYLEKLNNRESLNIPYNLGNKSEMELMKIGGNVFGEVTLSKGNVVERMHRHALMILEKYKCKVQLEQSYTKSESVGCGIALYAKYYHLEDNFDSFVFGKDKLGDKKISAESVAVDTAVKLCKIIDDENVCVDENLADNLVPLLGLCGGSMIVENISKHTLTNIKIIEQFLEKKFSVDIDKRMISY